MSIPGFPYPETLMRGNTTMRQIIEDHLRLTVPALIDVGRMQWGISAEELPYPKDYSATDPMESIDYPFIGSYCTGTDKFVRIGTSGSGSISYDAEYEVTLFVATSTAQLGTDHAGLPIWEKPERTSALRQRDDLLAIVRASILNTPSLGTAGGDVRYRARLREETLREASPEPVKAGDNRNPRWICSGIINVNINLSETTVVPLVGVAASVSSDVSLDAATLND